MKKTQVLIGLLLVLALVFVFSEVRAQTESGWVLRLTRNFGYGSGSDIQGTMTLSLDGDLTPVVRVVYYIDDNAMDVVTQSPFKLSFSTNDYEPGVHKIRAVISTADGKLASAGPIVYNFLSAAESGKKTTNILVAVIGISLGSMAVSWLISSRQKGSTTTTGGMHGIAVCNRCGKSFSRSFFGMNLVVGKFERCPHCGKWQLTRRASPLEIEWANEDARSEQAEVAVEKPKKDDLDESKFIDM